MNGASSADEASSWAPSLPNSASAASDSTEPTRKYIARVPRTMEPCARWYISASGGPPIELAVPVKPEMAPAASRLPVVGATSRPEALTATAASVSTPRVIASGRCGRMAIAQAPSTVPGTLPSSAQRTPRSMPPRLR
jgi:hypothetical protein